MKVYVAGRYKNKEKILGAYEILESKGHNITNEKVLQD